MSKKFSIVISVSDEGKVLSKCWQKENAQLAIDEFNKLREAGREVYLFQSPVPTKSSKSDADKKKVNDALSK